MRDKGKSRGGLVLISVERKTEDEGGKKGRKKSAREGGLTQIPDVNKSSSNNNKQSFHVA